jgi:exo-beta-1,3-glucanase (GH17 family)
MLNSNKLSASYVSGVLVENKVLFYKVSTSGVLASKTEDVKSQVKSHGLLVGNCESVATFASSTIESSDFLVVNIHPYIGQVKASRPRKI